MNAKILKYCFLIAILLFAAGKLRAQFPLIHMVPLDSIVFDSSQIKGMEFINYNEDIYVDYFFSTNNNAYLIDGFSNDTLWSSPPDTFLKHENIEFIQSTNEWRNYRIEKIDDGIYKISWFNLPSLTPSDSLVFESNYSETWYPELYAGFFSLNNTDCYYIQPSRGMWQSMTLLEMGEFQLFGHDNDSLYFTAWFPRYVENYAFYYDSSDLLIVAGNVHWHNYEMGGSYGDFVDILILVENLGIQSPITIPNFIIYSAHISQANENTPPEVLLAGIGKVYYYSNVFNDSTEIYNYFPNNINYARFINYQSDRLIINACFNTYFEIWDLNLNFYSYVTDQLPDSLKNIYTRDIDFDGTDEVFCVYDSKVIICGLFEQVDISSSEIMPYKIGFKNYTNPFNSSTTISYTLSIESDVSLAVYDVLGRQIERLVDGHKSAGTHSVNWNTSDRASGIYFAVLETEEITKSIKMVLLK